MSSSFNENGNNDNDNFLLMLADQQQSYSGNLLNFQL